MHMLPSLHELRKCSNVDCFDLLSERSKRSPARNFSNTARTPLRISVLTPESTSNELSGSLPFRKPHFDPALVPSISLVDLLHRHRTRKRNEERENLSSRCRSSHHRFTQCRRNIRGTKSFASKRGHIPWIGLRKDVPWLTVDTESNCHCTLAQYQITERIAAHAFFISRYSRAQLRFSEISCSIKEMCELVSSSRASSRRISTSFCNDLSNRIEREIVPRLLSHHFAKQR